MRTLASVFCSAVLVSYKCNLTIDTQLQIRGFFILVFCVLGRSHTTDRNLLLFILGEMNKNRQPNFLVVNNETPLSDIEGKRYVSVYIAII